MQKELELWQFIAARLERGENVMLLVVAESSGSSPGRRGYKMAIGEDREITGSIGGGVMEVNLVEESRRALSVPPAVAGGFREQIHRKDVDNASGMICSGRQTVIFRRLSPSDVATVASVIDSLQTKSSRILWINSNELGVSEDKGPPVVAGGTDKIDPANVARTDFSRNANDFTYTEMLGPKNNLYIVGGGHCALALCELMSKMDFHISLFDDRPELNTIEKNGYADVIKIVDSYDRIGDHIPSGVNAFVVVMTLGYKTDE
ncbi:MAG TPA: XdhC family protein, partial [Pyrinomonadaceae bacterium]|nr:XdhC family protein [Pyrinomonadaceae bacterium]